LGLNGFCRGASETGRSPPERIPSYWVLNGYLSYQIEGMALVGGVCNLLDKEYYTHTNSCLPRGLPNRGREFRIGVEVKL